MSERLTVITRKGQVTIPADIRRALKLKQGDMVAFVLEDDQALLRRSGSVVERTAGILKADQPVLSAEELRREAENAIAKDAVKRALP